MPPLVFLPGAGGSAAFWEPVAQRLASDQGLQARPMQLLSWPGLGNEPADEQVRCFDDLASRVLAALHPDEFDEPADLIAQSMGGVVALQVALRAPRRVRRIVLTATSGGMPMDEHGAADWRDEYRRAFPRAQPWIYEPVADLSARLAGIPAPCLLLWGDADPISPVAAGQRLLSLLPHADLRIIEGGGHDLAMTHAEEAARHIRRHLL